MRIKVEIDVVDLSIHKHIDMLRHAFKKYFNWAIRRVVLIHDDREIQILPEEK